MAPKRGDGRIFGSCDISLENMPTSHAVSLCACYLRTHYFFKVSFVMRLLTYAITANGVCLHLLVPPLAQCCFFGASCLHNSMYCSKNGWAYFREKSTLCNNFIQKKGGGGGGVGVFSRVGLFSGDYGIIIFADNAHNDVVHAVPLLAPPAPLYASCAYS